MNHILYNDQAYIAGSFQLNEDFITQASLLACFKIVTYKHSLARATYKRTREELRENINNSLLNYTSSCIILADLGFFQSETDN
jgi:hypothetical protein